MALLLALLLLAAIAVTAWIRAREILRMRIPLSELALGASFAVAWAAAIVVGVIASLRWPRAALVAAIAIAVALRLLVALAVELPQGSDWAVYMDFATGLLKGAPPFSDRPMGWPMLLATAWALFGQSVRTGVLLNVAVSTLTAVLLGYWIRRFAGPAAATAGVIAWAFLPRQVLFNLLLGTETTYTFLLLAIVVAADLALRRLADGSSRSAIGLMLVVGLAVGVSYWVRTTSSVLLPFLALVPFMAGIPRRRAALAGVVVLAGGLLVIAPILAFNGTQVGRWTPSNSFFTGWQLFIGNNEHSGGQWNTQDKRVIEGLLSPDALHLPTIYATGALPIAALVDRLAVDDELAHRGLDRLRQHGLRYPIFLAHKVENAWASGASGVRKALIGAGTKVVSDGVEGALELFADASWLAILAAALVAVWRQRRRVSSQALIVAAVALPMAAALLLLEAQPRYHEYLVPLFTALGAAAVAGWVTQLLPRRSAVEGQPAATTG